jgi:two-component system sensor histidine kinase/response regulator
MTTTRVLGIDDSPTQAEKLRFILEEAGYDVVIARTGEEGLVKLGEGPFDLLITDVVMPGIDGFEVCRQVKANLLHGGLPVILLTTLADPIDIIHGLECGADNFLTKPYEAEYLVARVETLLENRRLRAGHKLSLGAEISFRGKRFVINAEREQVLDLLVSTFEDAVMKNSELLDRERDLAAARERLEERNQALLERGHELTEKNAQLERATQAKSDFLAGMSHELRTPLNAIIGFSELLAEEIAGPLAAPQHEYVSHVVEAGKHLLSLINDVLDLAKVEAGRIELRREPSNLAALVEAVEQIVSPLAVKRELHLTVDIPSELPSFLVDPIRMKQVLYNLLSNAIKFTPPHGQVRLTARRVDDQMEISVADSGPGISAEDLPRLFQPFEQLEAGLRKLEGTGLGLSLTRRLINLHGGEIRVESEPGQGSRFIVTVPLNGRPALKPALMAADSSPGSRPLVLVIEDDAEAAELIAAELSEAGYAVALTDQHHALEKAETLDPYAITLDLMMPDIEGYAILGQLKRSRTARRVPVVVVSIVDDSSHALLMGAAEALVKPVPKGKLIEAIERVRRLEGLAPLPRILLVGPDPVPCLRALERLAGACEVFPVGRLTPGLAVFTYAPPDLAIAIAGGCAISGEILDALATPPLASARVIIVGDGVIIPAALEGRLAGVIRAAEVEEKLWPLVHAALPTRLSPLGTLPDRPALVGKLEEIAKRGALAGVALIGVTLPGPASLAPQRLEKLLRRRDFVACLSPARYVLLAPQTLGEDIPGLERRFLEAIATAANCQSSALELKVVFGSPDDELSPEDLVGFLAAGGSS